jgi:large subunit ribosomal protein L33
MNKNKNSRIFFFLECSECLTNQFKRSKGVSRYLTSKNRRTTTNKLELKKYCRFCNKHTLHKELK